MKNLLFAAFLSLGFGVKAQTFSQAYQNRVSEVSQNNIISTLTEFASFGAKTTGSTNNNNAYTWLQGKYLAAGYPAEQLTENVFTYSGKPTKNLIVTKTGTLYPNTFVIVCAHYDTIGGPGVNDNGSGTALLLEMARLLKDVPTEYSIKFIHFTGEEQGLLGSKNYVNTVVNATSPKMNIKLVLNIDQVGGVAGQVNNKVTCERDTNNSPSTNNAASNAVTQQLMTCVGLYSPLQTHLASAYASDYMPFQSNGEVITGLYEFNESPYPHSANDTFANMDPVFVYNVTKAALGAVQHFAVADQATLAVTDCPPEKMLESLRIFPNPTANFLNIDMLNSSFKDFNFTVSDLNGRVLGQTQNQKRIDVSNLPVGVYLGTMTVEDRKVTKKIIIRK